MEGKKMARTDPQLNVRIPNDVYEFLQAQTRMYASSLSSEVTRAIRERMEKETKTATE
jgi:hypothetical protein